MAYTRNTWVDRVVQYARRYRDQNNNQITLTPDPGTVTAEGTTINAAKLNNIEGWIETTDALIVDTAQANKLVKTNSSGDFPGNALSVDGIHFRNTTGILEYSTDGVVWNAVGGKLVKASDTVQHTFATEYTVPSGNIVLAGGIKCDFSGIVRIKADMLTGGASNPAKIYTGIPVGATSQVDTPGFIGSSAVSAVPIGTIITSGVNYGIASGLQTASTTYVTLTGEFKVNAGDLFAVLMLSDYNGSKIKNVKFCYDLLTGTEALT